MPLSARTTLRSHCKPRKPNAFPQLSQLFSAVSLRKIDLRQAALLAYIAQLMLQTNKLANPSLTHATTLPSPPLAD
jgi:hypothetical protein